MPHSGSDEDLSALWSQPLPGRRGTALRKEPCDPCVCLCVRSSVQRVCKSVGETRPRPGVAPHQAGMQRGSVSGSLRRTHAQIHV